MSPDSLLNLPPEIQGPSAWYGPEMLSRRDWIEHLSETEIAEVERATKPLADARIDITAIHRDDFPLPMLGHVKDLGLSSIDPNTRIYQTRERQTFHTDSCDVVALLCLRRAKSGGLSSLVSSVTIFNEMRRRRPDLAKILFEPVETDRRGEMDAGQKPYFLIPVFNWRDELLSTIYQRQYIESARRLPDVPPLTAGQIEAMDMFDALANDPALNMHMEFRPGDIQLVHNHTILHDRTAFEDWPEPERKRHLLRLWLAPANARPLPPVFAERYGRITPGDRGGLALSVLKLTAPLDAE
jgi:hypothetical protein